MINGKKFFKIVSRLKNIAGRTVSQIKKLLTNFCTLDKSVIHKKWITLIELLKTRLFC